MKKLFVTTFGLCSIALTIMAFEQLENKTIKIELTEQEAGQYSQSMDKVISIINDSDMISSERKECKKLLLSANTLLSSKIKIDTLKKK